MGFTDTTIVNDGMEAIEEIARAEELGISYDLVLMDMLMPVAKSYKPCTMLITLP